MLQIEQIGNKNIYTFKIDASLDTSDIKKLLDFIVEKGEANGKIKIIIEVLSISAFNNVRTLWKALVLKYEAVQVISAYALLTDTKWIADLLPIGNFFTPGLEIQQFALDQRAAAIFWLDKQEI